LRLIRNTGGPHFSVARDRLPWAVIDLDLPYKSTGTARLRQGVAVPLRKILTAFVLIRSLSAASRLTPSGSPQVRDEGRQQT
jgi:hypothetical protein